MNQPNPEQLARQGMTEYDKLSDEDLRKLLNASAQYMGKSGNFQPHRTPTPPKFIDYDARFGSQ